MFFPESIAGHIFLRLWGQHSTLCDAHLSSPGLGEGYLAIQEGAMRTSRATVPPSCLRGVLGYDQWGHRAVPNAGCTGMPGMNPLKKNKSMSHRFASYPTRLLPGFGPLYLALFGNPLALCVMQISLVLEANQRLGGGGVEPMNTWVHRVAKYLQSGEKPVAFLR